MAYCGRIWHQTLRHQSIALLSFILVVLVFAYYEHDANVWMNASDALIAIGLSMFVFTLFLKQGLGINKALAAILVFEIGYSFLRSWIFAPQLESISQQMTPLYESYAKQIPTLKVEKDTLIWIQQFMLQYQSAIWGSVQIAGAFLGLLFFNRTSWLKLPNRLIRLPYILIYLLIASLGMALYPLTRDWGINLLICTGIVYLIQGTAVLSFIWGNFFMKARLLRTFLIIAIIFNYPVLILIALIGILDVWFDFRKLTLMEEKHESNID